MSAPAPALAATPDRALKIRLADVAVAGGCVSLLFSLLLVGFPDYFPRMILESWSNGHLIAGLLLFAVLFNCALYVGIARMRSATTTAVGYLAIGSGTAATALTFSWIVPVASLVEQQNLTRVRAREEVLFLVYFAVVAAIFVPFLIIRLTQEFKKKQR